MSRLAVSTHSEKVKNQLGPSRGGDGCRGALTEEDEDTESSQAERYDLPRYGGDVEEEDGLPGRLKGRREDGRAVVAQHGDVGDDDKEGKRDGRQDGQVQGVETALTGDLRHPKGSDRQDSEDVAQEHGRQARGRGARTARCLFPLTCAASVALCQAMRARARKPSMRE